MIRFVDLTGYYWTDGSVNLSACAFADIVTGKFIPDNEGQQIFFDPGDLDYIEPKELADRCKKLLPEGFFEKKPADFRAMIRAAVEKLKFQAEFFPQHCMGKVWTTDVTIDQVLEYLRLAYMKPDHVSIGNFIQNAEQWLEKNHG